MPSTVNIDQVKRLFENRGRIFKSVSTEESKDLIVDGNLEVKGGISLGKNKLKFKDWTLKV